MSEDPIIVAGPYPFIQAKWRTSTNGRTPRLVVLHTMETNELRTSAEAVGRYFARGERRASAHYGVDPGGIVQYVRDQDIAWGVPGRWKGRSVNGFALHVEQAGYAGQSAAEWRDEASSAMLKHSAALVAAKCREYGIPRTRLRAADLKRDPHGITGHVDCSEAFGGDHWDPGPQFPWDAYLSLVVALFHAEQREPVAVFVNGREVPGAGAYVENGRSFGILKALAEPLALSFGPPQNGQVAVLREGLTARDLPAFVEQGRTVVALAELQRFPGVSVGWEGGAVHIRTGGAG